MSELTEQIIFNTVVRHFKEQKVPAIEGAQCRYRTPDGLRCAIGVLITDEEYTPLMDELDGAVDVLLDRSLLPERLLPFAHGKFAVGDDFCDDGQSFLRHLQAIHDAETASLLTHETAAGLDALAEARGLDASEVDWA